MIIRTHLQSLQIALFTFILFLIIFSSIVAAQDSDLDGMPDDWEQEHGLESDNATDANYDPDNDNLTNVQEYDNNTDPNDPDTDNDGMEDGWEVEYNLDPRDPRDSQADPDGDNWNSLEEYIYGTDPLNRTSYPKPTEPSKDDDEGETLIGTGSSFCFFVLVIIVAVVVILILIIFVYTKLKREQLLEHRIRQQLFTYIQGNPGTHYRKIMNELNLQMGTLTHHLNMLEQQQYIKSLQDGMYRRFYPYGVQPDSKLILTEIQTKILDEVQRNPGSSQVNIARNLGVARKVINYHIKILADAGFIYIETNGRESACYFKGET